MLTLKNFIEKYVYLPDNDWNYISEIFEKKVFNKNDLIVAEGKICRYFYFLEEGLIRHFILNDGNEITKYFVPAPFCITSRISFLNQLPSKENIQAIEKSITWKINRQQYTDLMKLNTWRDFTRKILHEVQDHTESILLTSLSETAEIRYEKMLYEDPGLINRIPLKQLASYLGIAKQSLSRIRKKYSKKTKLT